MKTLPLRAECPIFRAADEVGDWWTLLILRDAFQGFTRFDEFEASLGIAPNMLAGRLKQLVACGILEKRAYQQSPRRYDYVLTGKGRDFFPVFAALLGWSNRHLAGEGAALLLAARDGGAVVEPQVVDAHSGIPLVLNNVVATAGPKASRQMRVRLESLKPVQPAS